MKINKKILIGTLICALMMTGCNSDAPEDEVKNKDEIVISVVEEPQSGFDATTGNHGSLTNMIFSTLFKRGENMEIKNDLAQEYQVSEDRMTWTIKIKEDIVFSDNEKLTSEDVGYSYEQAKKSGSDIDLSMLESVNIVDDYTIEFNLTNPQSTFIEKMTDVGIVPKHAHDDKFVDNPIGSGPYKLIQWDKGQQIIFEKNESYYGKEANIPKVTLVFLDEDSAYAAIKSGDIDLAKISSSLANEDIENTKVYELESIETYGVSYPMNKQEVNENQKIVGNDVTSDIAIRKAMTYAIDREELVKGILNGHGKSSTTGLENMSWLNKETIIKEDGDIEKAKKILGDAGWIDTNNNQIIDKDGIEAEFNLLYTPGEYRQELALMYQLVAQELNIKVNIEMKNWDTIEDYINKDAVLYGWGSADPSEIYSLYSSEMIDTQALWNNSGQYSNEKVDEYIDKALQSESEEEAIKYWKKAQYDGQTGFSSIADCTYTWMINANHLYISNDKLDIGNPIIQPHGGRILDNITEWSFN